MENERMDRRVQRTRQLLNEALMSLIAEKGYESITVQNIIDHANLGRSTFYSHYQDKEDLLLSSIDNVVRNLISGLEHSPMEDGEHHTLLSTVPLFRHARVQDTLHKKMVGGRGIDILIKEIQKHLCRHFLAKIKLLLPEGQTPSVPTPVTANYLAGALLTLLTWWLDNDMPHSPERMDEMFQQLVMPGVWVALEVKP